MKTAHLINILSQDRVPPPHIRVRVFAFAGGTVLLAAVVMQLLLGFRPNLFAALSAPVTAMKWLLPLIAAVPAMFASVALIDPQKQRTPVIWATAAVGGIVVLWYIWAVAHMPSELLWPTIRGSTIFRCLISITLFSMPALIVALWWLRDGASTSPMRSGALAGLAVAGVTTVLYSMFCGEDAPLFFLTWYSLAVVTVSAIGAFLGKRLLRW